jgi:hypothetical protein
MPDIPSLRYRWSSGRKYAEDSYRLGAIGECSQARLVHDGQLVSQTDNEHSNCFLPTGSLLIPAAKILH